MNPKIYCSRIKFFYLDQKLSTEIRILREKEGFIYSVSAFCEAHHYNLGLNQKVCITKEGLIKNHISHADSHDNVNTSALLEVINKKTFKTKWLISNDKIEKCKDCQFKYSCSSNSDIISKNGLYYKVNLCEFNPYTNVWN